MYMTIEQMLPPLPVDLAAAWEEIRTLQRIMIEERRKYANMVERRELDRRAMKGTVRAQQEENAELRAEIKKLRQRLESLVTSQTPFDSK